MIRIENIGKRYRLGGGVRHDTLRDLISHRAGRLLGRGRESAEDTPSGEFWALKDVTFDVEEGEVVGIIGRNGAGKSTLLKILSRITPPTEGRIRLKGRIASLLEVGTGFHPELTGRENIFMNGSILGMRRAEIRAKLDEIIAFSEVEKFIDMPVKHYSSGMYVRLAFAVAAHLEPEILVVDEVLAVGDIAFQRKCMGKMNDVARGGRTVLFVSHNMPAVSSLTSKAVLLDGGRLVKQDHTDEVIRWYLREMRDKSPSTRVIDRTDRDGDGRARIVDIFVDDQEGNVNILPLSKSPKRINIEIDAEDCVAEINIAISIFNSDRRRIVWTESSLSTDLFTFEKGRHKLRIDLARGFSPTPGEYFVNAALISSGGMVDYVADALKFSIETGDFFGRGRLPNTTSEVLVDHTWNIA